MAEGHGLGMQEEAGGPTAIQVVAYDGGVQSFRMGGMHPQLVGAPREGIEGHAGLTVAARQDLKTRDGGFAVYRAHHLPWTVVRVGAEGKTDKAFVVRYRAVEQSYVSFFDVPRFKQLLQLSVRFRVFGDEEHSRGVHVQAVHQERSRGLGKMRTRPAPYGRGIALAGYGKHAGRFIDSSHPFVFVDEFRLVVEMLAVLMCVGFHIQTL